MKISRDRFEEILSLYLDGEASPEELALLAKCVREDRRMASMYYGACRGHEATCKLYGKEASFAPLEGVVPPFFKPAKPSKMRVALEWCAVSALMLASAALMWTAVKTLPADALAEESAPPPSFDDPRHCACEISAHASFSTPSGGVFSIISVRRPAPLVNDCAE